MGRDVAAAGGATPPRPLHGAAAGLPHANSTATHLCGPARSPQLAELHRLMAWLALRIHRCRERTRPPHSKYVSSVSRSLQPARQRTRTVQRMRRTGAVMYGSKPRRRTSAGELPTPSGRWSATAAATPSPRRLVCGQLRRQPEAHIKQLATSGDTQGQRGADLQAQGVPTARRQHRRRRRPCRAQLTAQSLWCAYSRTFYSQPDLVRRQPLRCFSPRR
jgi:hypothetical protein